MGPDAGYEMRDTGCGIPKQNSRGNAGNGSAGSLLLALLWGSFFCGMGRAKGAKRRERGNAEKRKIWCKMGWLVRFGSSRVRDSDWLGLLRGKFFLEGGRKELKCR